MGKRSRDASFSPSVDEASTPSSAADTQLEPESEAIPRAGKFKAFEWSQSPAHGRMQCSLPPHRDAISFASIEDYEVHYAKEHSNRCSSCGKNLPTPHFLALHIDEKHNPLREAAQAKGEKTFACFVEDCDRKCSTPQKRRMHLIDKHMFPKAYHFRIVDTGIDRSTSLLRGGQRRRVSTANEPKESATHRRRASSGLVGSHVASSASQSSHQGEASRSVPELTAKPASTARLSTGIAPSTSAAGKITGIELDDLERSMSALRFVPTSVLMKQGKQNDKQPRP